MKFGEMEFGEMKRIGAIFACFRVARVCQRQLGFLVCYAKAPLCFKVDVSLNFKLNKLLNQTE